MRAAERCLRVDGAQRPQRHLGRGQLGDRAQRRRQAARIEPRERRSGGVDAADEERAAHSDQARLQRVGVVGARLERRLRCGERARRAAEIAHRQRHLRFGDDAARTRQLLVRAERARRAADELARARMLAELRHRDAAQGERRRIVAQADALERTERVAGGERTRGGRDHRIHRRRLPGDVGPMIPPHNRRR